MLYDTLKHAEMIAYNFIYQPMQGQKESKDLTQLKIELLFDEQGIPYSSYPEDLYYLVAEGEAERLFIEELFT